MDICLINTSMPGISQIRSFIGKRRSISEMWKTAGTAIFWTRQKDPSQKTYNRMMKLYDMTLESRERRAREEEHAELAAKERIRNEKESERLHNERIRSFADGLIERKKEKIEAEAAQREKEEREARKERESIERFRHYSGSVDKAREISERANEIMLRRKKREEEHKRQMAWFDSQKRG